MPIGKNAIKRVKNNGYSKVETSAPDMENSSVIANIDEQVMEKIVAPIEKKTRAKKAVKAVEVAPVAEAPKKAPTKRKTAAVAEPVAVETPAKPKRKYTRRATPKTAKTGFDRVEVGEKMPYFLL